VPIASDNAAAKISGTPAVIDTGVIVIDHSNSKFFLRDRVAAR